METKTAEAVAENEAARIELKSLAVAKPGTEQIDRLAPKAIEWTEARVELLRKQVCPPSATRDEFDLFLEWCRMTGLNPFIQQAYLIPRRQKVGEKWVDKHQPLAAIAGVRALVDLQPDHQGFEGGAVYAGDRFGVNQKTGEVIHEWDLESRIARGWKCVGAWGRAVRRGRITKLVFLPIESRIQDSPFWRNDPSGQITKCAEAAAYREAYPNVLAGVFIAEEWSDTGAPAEVDVTPPTSATTKTSALRERVEAAAEAAIKATAQRRDEKKGNAPKPAAPAGPATLPIEQIRFGKFKGKLIADLSTIELEAVLTEAETLRPKVTGQWLPPFNEGVAAVQNEIALRERGGEVGQAAPTEHAVPRDGMTTQREPGAEG